ncbi:MAG: serine/threonine protein kinase [Melioribacteraceae bacterium]|nr:serine/threonine protein kinase [Melioribacteraceae bacterium]MCF8266402.1 serine/threonine protein kinase [Melioribacteraceae bacterium]MCF8413167.1 serine/threonine protein kinase [Melioribacteraceae bacterium]
MANLIGHVVDNYEFVELLGRGGMGTVYKAYDIKLQRNVAIKIIDESLIENNSSFLERFRREARNQAQLVHPNVVVVYGFIEYDDVIGIVMEHVKGHSIDRILRKQGRLHMRDAIHIMKEALAGLGYAHSKGFVHRDIKPSNIMIEPGGAVKIMDFGISKSIFEKGVTKTGANIGTAYYMSPEQIRAQEVTHHTDIYSMGCTLYEILTGEPPFSFESEYELFEAHLSKNPTRPSRKYPDIPASLDAVVLQAMNKKYYERFNSCRDFSNALDVLEEKIPKVTSSSSVQTKQKTSTAGVLFIVFFLIFISVIIYFLFTNMDIFLKDNPFTK